MIFSKKKDRKGWLGTIFKIGKKGQIVQIAFLLVSIVAIAVTLLVATYVTHMFFTGLKTGQLNTTETNSVETNFDTVPHVFDYSMVGIVIFLAIVLIVTSWAIPTHPIFLVINIFGILFLVLLAMVMSNFFGILIGSSGSVLGTTADEYPITVFLINYLPWICVIITLLSTIIMYAKGSSGGQSGY